MARRWQAVQVELLGGGGIVCDPPPGRVLVCPTGTTFDQLGLAVDLAFARWDLSHLRMFELPDGTMVMDEELAADTVSDPFSPAIPRTVYLTARVGREVNNGDVFSYTFDLGDNWRHRCEVIGRVDPEEVLGAVPDRPTAYWGWGLIPDQYGRRWSDDDGESEPPELDMEILEPRTAAPGKTITGTSIRAARAAGSVQQLIEALTGVVLEPGLQQAGSAVLTLWHGKARTRERAALAPYLMSLVDRLDERAWLGDAELAAVLLASLRGDEQVGRPVQVDLDEFVSAAAHEAGGEFAGCYLNQETGDVVPTVSTDEGMVGEDAIEVEGAEWLYLELEGTIWSDLEEFTRTVTDESARNQLTQAIDGKGAFSRFRRVTDELGLREEWLTFGTDREWGRARATLAEHGISVIG